MVLKFFSKFANAFLLLACITSAAAAQQKPQTPDTKPRKTKQEPATIFKEWPKTDVSLIISDPERKAYEKLATDDEREQFIQAFWRRRDPDPDTEENEFKEQHYERIAYANEHYASGKAGWLTDRGRIYVKFGKPDEIESHPTGGSYQQASYEGGRSITTYPFEKWLYRYIPGVGSGIEIEFVDPTGSGEYRLARGPNDKNAFQIGGGLGAANTNDTYRREQDSPFAIQELRMRLESAPEFKANDLDASLTGSPTVDDNPINLEVSSAFFRQSDNRVITAFTIQTENRDLSFKDLGGLQTARLNIIGQISAVTGQRIGVFEDSVTTTATVAELNEAQERKSAYSKAVVLAPGRYRITVRVRDVESGAEGIKFVSFQVPTFDERKLAVSSLILTSKLKSLKNQPTVGPFVIGQHKVVPNLTHIYAQGQPVGLYFQIYNSGIDQTTLRPSVDIEYALLKDGKEIKRQSEEWDEVSDAGQRLTIARFIETKTAAPGEYELVIRVKDRVSGQTLTPSAKFTIVR
jgi:GWxTD domain-containing protein